MIRKLYVPKLKQHRLAARDVWGDTSGRLWLLLVFEHDDSPKMQAQRIRDYGHVCCPRPGASRCRRVFILNDATKEMREFAGTLNDARDRMRAAGMRRLSKRTRRTRPL